MEGSIGPGVVSLLSLVTKQVWMLRSGRCLMIRLLRRRASPQILLQRLHRIASTRNVTEAVTVISSCFDYFEVCLRNLPKSSFTVASGCSFNHCSTTGQTPSNESTLVRRRRSPGNGFRRVGRISPPCQAVDKLERKRLRSRCGSAVFPTSTPTSCSDNFSNGLEQPIHGGRAHEKQKWACFRVQLQ